MSDNDEVEVEVGPGRPGKVAFALTYAHLGYRVLPAHWIQPDGKCSCRKPDCGSPAKHPVETAWQGSATIDEGKIRWWWERSPDGNIGIKCGKDSGPKGLTVLDVDGDLGRDTLHELEAKHGALPPGPMVITGRGGNHYYFQCEASLANAVRFAPGLDIRTKGGLVIGVGSKTRDEYRFEVGAPHLREGLPSMPGWLIRAVHEKQASKNGAPVKLPDKIHEGEGRNNALWKVGRSLKSRGVPESAIRAGMLAANQSVCKPPMESSEIDKLIENVIKQPDSAEFKAEAEADPREPDEPDMTLVNESRRPAVPFPMDVFNPDWRKWIGEQSDAVSAPVDFVAAPLLTAASGVIGNTRWVSPWEGWSEPPLIWSSRNGIPGSGKSPAADRVAKLMHELDSGLNRDHPKAIRAYEAAKLKAAIKRQQWEEGSRERVEHGGTPEPMPEDAVEPDEPPRQRLVVDDTTIEAVALIAAANPRGLCSEHDELAEWLGSFDKYGGRNDRPFWLQAYGGCPRIIDRVKHPIPITVSHLSIAVGGGIQPDRLPQALTNTTDDGLACRFAYFWPDAVDLTRPECIPDNQPARSAFARLLSLEMQAGESLEPVVVPLEEYAAGVFHSWRYSNVARQREASGLLLSWLGKCPGFVVRIALVLEFLDWSIELRPDQPTCVSVGCVQRAIRLVDTYLIPMAERTFGDALLPEVERHAAMIARLIYARRIGEKRAEGVVVNRRLIQRMKLPGLRTAAQVGEAIEYLVEAGWLEQMSKQTGGRRKGDYLVKPAVWTTKTKET